MDYPDLNLSLSGLLLAAMLHSFVWNHGTVLRFSIRTVIFSQKRGILSLMPEAEKTYHLKITLEA